MASRVFQDRQFLLNTNSRSWEITKADRIINPQVLMLAKDGSWQYAIDPIHYDKPIAGAGLARSFAIELAKQDKLAALAERFRKDLDAPEVPFIIGQLGRFEAKPWTEARTRINQAHAEAATEIKYAGFVSSFGLTSKADNSHFNTKSLHEFGKRYACRYLQVVNEGDDSMFH